ncbi:unnamed protein product [Phytophthora lilii]|uniref:Unnamed protein product n=1 Tax=Phytophthora lilii TaxID=2077276 RepID=A0A9W6TE50_9STRA|nr:unnamed protein product [Phytophthora lilii]
MMLDDGRFLMKAESYDSLVEQGYSVDALDAQNLVRVHPDFRVIALGLPVPPYPGRTLDPPLRSRFQARNIRPSSPGSQLEELVAIAPSVPLPTLEKLVGIREAVNTIETTYDLGTSTGPRMPHFDYLSLSHCAKVLEQFPDVSVAKTVQRAFPVRTSILGVKMESNSKALDRIVANFTNGLKSGKYQFAKVVKVSAEDVESTVTFTTPAHDSAKQRVVHNVPCGTTRAQMSAMAGFVETKTHSDILVELIQDHSVGSDLCILGAKGSGKSALARLFAHRMGYATELFSLFKDMTARDLLQRRSTDSRGNTQWEDSPLIYAARRGHLAVLDGVHRLGSDSLSVLQRLVQDREIDLADGSKLVSQTVYNEIVADANKSGDASALSRVSPIHPSFRIIAIAEADPATLKGTTAVPGKESTAAWLSSDNISMFSFHHLPQISPDQSEPIIRHLYPDLPQETTSAKENSSNADYLALSLSTRQLLRVCRRLNAFPKQSLQDLRPLLHDTLLTQFLSSSCTALVDSIFDECNVPRVISASDAQQQREQDSIREEAGRLHIGDVSHPIETPASPELVPQPHYFDIPKHTSCMKDMLQDVVAGQKHMLLIGNQGVGKNKLADRLLQLLQQEREYIQLHRDTTVQTLTLVPTLIDGRIKWEDSPLVRAAKTGRTLIVDEADKAPLEVVCVLKGLIEDGEMLLGNGKRLIDPAKVAIEEWHDEENIIVLHPNFRMWVLANRPGFPFLGNNFFREIGDIFASQYVLNVYVDLNSSPLTHVVLFFSAIDNPDEESELSLLTAYAPSVPITILRRLCKAFAELRELVEDGTITYPYSTRGAVAVAKHLEQFPNDGVASVLQTSFVGLTLFLNPHGNVDGRAQCLTLPDGVLDGRLHLDASSSQSWKKTRQNPFTKWFGHGNDRGWRSEADVVNAGLILRYLQGGSLFQILDLILNKFLSIDLAKATSLLSTPIAGLLSVQPLDKNEWVIRTTNEEMVYKASLQQDSKFVVSVGTTESVRNITSLSPVDTRHSVIPGRQQNSIVNPVKFMVHPRAFLQMIDGNDGEQTIRSAHRENDREVQQAWQYDSFIVNSVRSDRGDLVDIEVTFPELLATKNVVVGASSEMKQLKDDRFISLSTDSSHVPRVVDAASVHDGEHMLTLQEDGAIRVWQLHQASLDREAKLWKQMYGRGDDLAISGALDLKVNGSRVGGPSIPKTGLNAPKYGKDDPNNDPHVGGNTWAGGTGGSDTAGLGGRGGPYRLDKGHPVHQVSQEKKDEVSAEARAKAHAMAQEALAEKLREIDMSDREWEAYQSYFKRVERESAQLRAVLANLEAVAQERNWLRHQSSGELDDGKLVDGVAGERNVFKRRGVNDSPFQAPAGHQQGQEPKRMLFVMDVSGSMYRFNGQDSRLERMLETSLMIMESFAGFERELDYCIMGHSGDSPEIPFVEFGAPPKDRKERLQVLQKMVAHTQYCRSGDHTVEAVERGVLRIAAMDGDDRFVFVVSDANLERYGIEPRYLGQKLLAEPGVQAHALFIASFADEAERIRRDLPAGRGHVCLDTSDLPRMFKQIFTSAVGGN